MFCYLYFSFVPNLNAHITDVFKSDRPGVCLLVEKTVGQSLVTSVNNIFVALQVGVNPGTESNSYQHVTLIKVTKLTSPSNSLML